MTTTIAKIKVLGCIAAAVANLENTNADGTINWDFVSADVYMDLKPAPGPDSLLIDVMIDQFADGYEYKTTVGVKKNFA